MSNVENTELVLPETDELMAQLEETEAPATKTEPVTRDSLLKPPDWRYQAACQYISDMESGNNPTVPSDPVVQYAIRGIVGMHLNPSGKSGKGSQRFVKKFWPDLFETLWRGTVDRLSAVTTTLEIGLMKGWTWDQARYAGCPVNRFIYALYEKLFFDLTGVKTVNAWIQDYLFEPERYNGNTALLRARVMAYFGSGTSGMNASITGQLSKEEDSLVKTLIKNERQKKVFDYVIKFTHMEPELYANVMETALKGMTDRDFQEHMKDREDAGSSSLEELAEHMEAGIRAFSQQELAKAGTDGLDFVNQYTKAITGKGNEQQ